MFKIEEEEYYTNYRSIQARRQDFISGVATNKNFGTENFVS